MKEIFLVISTSPAGDKNIVAKHDYDYDCSTEVFYTRGAAWRFKQEMQFSFPHSHMKYSVKRIEL